MVKGAPEAPFPFEVSSKLFNPFRRRIFTSEEFNQKGWPTTRDLIGHFGGVVFVPSRFEYENRKCFDRPKQRKREQNLNIRRKEKNI